MSAISVATRYLDALVQRDPAAAPFAPGVRRVNNGRLMVEGEDALREVIRREPPLVMGPMRWVSGGDDEAAVLYRLEADMGGDAPIAAGVGERFAVEGGAIAEIEVVFSVLDQPGPDWDALVVEGPAGDVVEPARAYLAALVSHDGSALALDGGVRRVENGRVTAEGADELRAALESPSMDAVQSVSGERWLAAGDSAIVFYDLQVRAGSTDMTLRVAERFRARAGKLAEIEAVFTPQ